MVHLDEGASLGTRVAATSVALVGVAGQLRIAAGGEYFDVGARDVLTIPQGMTYAVLNRGPAVSVFASVRSTESEPADAAPLPAAHLLCWRSYRRAFRSGIMPRAEIFGHHRLSGPHTPLRTLLGHSVRIPPSQASPWHEVPRDLLFVQLKGEIEFSSAGTNTALHPGDLLYVRAGTPYSYANYGFSDALFFDIGGRILTPGATSTYYETDPGWPVRADAKSYKVVSDDPAFKSIYGS
jgi:mannose-6-phosphate isomerase-like protein (cupin superfamily)